LWGWNDDLSLWHGLGLRLWLNDWWLGLDGFQGSGWEGLSWLDGLFWLHGLHGLFRLPGVTFADGFRGCGWFRGGGGGVERASGSSGEEVLSGAGESGIAFATWGFGQSSGAECTSGLESGRFSWRMSGSHWLSGGQWGITFWALSSGGGLDGGTGGLEWLLGGTRWLSGSQWSITFRAFGTGGALEWESSGPGSLEREGRGWGMGGCLAFFAAL
jgi:hypothetical protein